MIPCCCLLAGSSPLWDDDKRTAVDRLNCCIISESLLSCDDDDDFLVFDLRDRREQLSLLSLLLFRGDIRLPNRTWVATVGLRKALRGSLSS